MRVSVVLTGSRIAITGTTGAGKTTLMSLLTRFYDPTTGDVLLDGVDLRAYRLADLRAQFAIVLQHPVLFSTTIAENIAYSRPDASVAEILATSPDYIADIGLAKHLSPTRSNGLASLLAFIRETAANAK